MFRLGVISKNNEYGLYKYVQKNFNWEMIITNANKATNTNTAEEELSAIKKYVYNGNTDIIPKRLVANYINYIYQVKTSMSDSVLNELDVLINILKTNEACKTEIGNKKLLSIRNFGETVPYLHNTISNIRKLILDSFVDNHNNIHYVNFILPEKLITFLELLSDSKAIKYDNNTFVIKCKQNTSSVMIMSGKYTEETIAKHLHNFLELDSALFNKDFMYESISYPADEDAKENLLKKLLASSGTTVLIDRLRRYDESINEYLRSYQKCLRDREKIVKELDECVDNYESVKKFKNVLDKLENSGIKWKINDWENSKLYIEVITPLFNFDERIIKKIIDNERIYDFIPVGGEWIVKLFEDCFVKNTKQIITQTKIYIDFSNRVFTRQPYYDGLQYESIKHHNALLKDKNRGNHTYMPNPHIARYNCWGQNGPVLTKLLNEQKYEEMMYCLKATLGNINFNDTTVITYLCSLIYCLDDMIICKDTETGKEYNKSELIKEYTKNEENKDN